MGTQWESKYAERIKGMTSSAIREILKLTQQPDVISFAGGLPAPEVFPIEDILEASQKVLLQYGEEALQYGLTEGFTPLRQEIALRASKIGAQVTPENILITSGSQQALDLLGKLFIDPGDQVLVENPTYLGALQAWNAYSAEYLSAPSDEEGLIITGLEKYLEKKPKFMYVIPTFQNPTGVTLPQDRREKLIELIDRYGVPIVEDDPYGALRFEGEHIPSLFDLESKRAYLGKPYTGNVIYLSTFSKILAPGLRLAWVIAPPDVIRKMVQAKQGTDLHTPTFNQMIAYELLHDGTIDNHLNLIRKVYHERRDLMFNSIKEHCPDCVTSTHPEGGLFLWIKLPEGYDSADVLKATIERKCAFVPGAPFHANGSGENTMRLNFSNSTPEQIVTGIKCLGEVLQDIIKV